MHCSVQIEWVRTRSKDKRDRERRSRRVASIAEDASGYEDPLGTRHRKQMANSGVVEAQCPSISRIFLWDN